MSYYLVCVSYTNCSVLNSRPLRKFSDLIVYILKLYFSAIYGQGLTPLGDRWDSFLGRLSSARVTLDYQ